MNSSQQQDKIRVLHNEMAFNRTESDWFAAFERSQDLWESVDNLFPEEQKTS